jgi:hypothetical protein
VAKTSFLHQNNILEEWPFEGMVMNTLIIKFKIVIILSGNRPLGIHMSIQDCLLLSIFDFYIVIYRADVEPNQLK